MKKKQQRKSLNCFQTFIRHFILCLKKNCTIAFAEFQCQQRIQQVAFMSQLFGSKADAFSKRFIRELSIDSTGGRKKSEGKSFRPADQSVSNGRQMNAGIVTVWCMQQSTLMMRRILWKDLKRQQKFNLLSSIACLSQNEGFASRNGTFLDDTNRKLFIILSSLWGISQAHQWKIARNLSCL